MRTFALLCALFTLVAIAPAAHAAPGPALRVDAGADRRPIPDDIYGISFADPALAAETGTSRTSPAAGRAARTTRRPTRSAATSGYSTATAPSAPTRC